MSPQLWCGTAVVWNERDILMTIYIAMLAGALALMPLCSDIFGKKGRAVYCAVMGVAFIFISALRFRVGYDYDIYATEFCKMQLFEAEDVSLMKMEKGFLFPMMIINGVSDSYITVFVITSLIIYSVIFYLIYKNSSSPWISTAAFLCFGLYFNTLCFLRQVMAALVVLYALKYMKEKFSLRFFVLIFAAACFHWSALIMVPLYFMLKIKPSWGYLGTVSGLTVIFCIFSRKAMYWIINHVELYKNYDPDTNPEASVGLSPKYTIMFGLLFLVCFIFRERIIKRNAMNSVYLNCFMYAVVFEAMGMRHGILSRFSIIVFFPVFLYLIPDAVLSVKEFIEEKFRSKKKRQTVMRASAVLAAFYAGASFVMLLAGNYNGVVPYMSYIDRPYDVNYDALAYEEAEEEAEQADEDADDTELSDTEAADEPAAVSAG